MDAPFKLFVYNLKFFSLKRIEITRMVFSLEEPSCEVCWAAFQLFGYKSIPLWRFHRDTLFISIIFLLQFRLFSTLPWRPRMWMEWLGRLVLTFPQITILTSRWMTFHWSCPRHRVCLFSHDSLCLVTNVILAWVWELAGEKVKRKAPVQHFF